ncbi:hypothetical protein CHX23_02400 [Rhodococcoides fascians]|nr:hypothetical protein CHX23_02400 [Rhodococcus fascians]
MSRDFDVGILLGPRGNEMIDPPLWSRIATHAWPQVDGSGEPGSRLQGLVRMHGKQGDAES